MAGWQRCDRCRRVLPAADFDDGSTTCRACLTSPVKASRAASTSPVTRSRTTPRAAAPSPVPAGPRPARLGVAGSGDLEVRERRARRVALEALAQLHPEDLQTLLGDARLAEGLRPHRQEPVLPDRDGAS